jgi:hypothetical protein
MTRSRLLFEAASVAILGLLLSAVLYSNWFRDCCMTSSRDVIGLLTLPAILFASAVGGGVHGATVAHVVIGLVLEMLCLWALLLLVRRARARRRRSTRGRSLNRDTQR